MRRNWNILILAPYNPYFFIGTEDGHYYPRIAGGGPGAATEVTSVVNIPPPTAGEQALERKQVELLELQVQEAQRQSKLLEESFPASQELLREQLSLTKELAAFQRRSLERQEGFEQQLIKALGPAEETAAAKEIRGLSEQRALSILKGEAPALSPQQAGLIEETFKAAETEATTQLRTFAEELAATRGLKLTDAPIGETVLRETGRMAGGLAGAKATAKLDVSQTNQAFQEGVRQFQEGLRQQAFMNRLALTGREMPGLGIGIMGAPSLLAGAGAGMAAPIASSGSILNRMQAGRLAGASQTQTTGFTPGVFDYFSALAGAGGTALGGWAMGGFKGSSERFKRDIEPLDVDEYERARLKVKETPVVRFKYKWDRSEDRKHLGIVIETSPEEVSRDGLTLDVPGYLGLTLAAVKGVDRRVDRLEARLPIGARGRLPVAGHKAEEGRLPVRRAA